MALSASPKSFGKTLFNHYQHPCGNATPNNRKNLRYASCIPQVFGGDRGARTHDLTDVNRTL